MAVVHYVGVTAEFFALCTPDLGIPNIGRYTICTANSLTFNNSTFCPHSVFVCFVWISEQTAIISLYNINWLVFITETVCVYCAVRTEFRRLDSTLVFEEYVANW